MAYNLENTFIHTHNFHTTINFINTLPFKNSFGFRTPYTIFHCMVIKVRLMKNTFVCEQALFLILICEDIIDTLNRKLSSTSVSFFPKSCHYRKFSWSICIEHLLKYTLVPVDIFHMATSFCDTFRTLNKIN